MRERTILARVARPTLFFGTLTILALAGCSAGPKVTSGSAGQSGSAGSAGNAGSSGQGGNSGTSGASGFGGIGNGGNAAGAAGMPIACKVTDDDAQNAPTCTQKAPADAFSPSVQWTWTAPPADPNAFLIGSFSTPLVGNFTDDNKDGEIDLCDIPDVLVTAVNTFDFGGASGFPLTSGGFIYMLAGDTGVQELKFPVEVDSLVYPAFGDINGDGKPDLLAADTQGHLMAFSHDGAVEWTSPNVGGYRTTFASAECTTIGIYDLDGDGNPEILFGWEVYDNKGNRLFGDPTNASEFDGQYWCVTPTAADLDGDGKLEVIMGHEAFRADGTIYYKLPNFKPAHPQVANLDDDPEPEIFLTNADGITILEHTGAIKFGPVRPTDPNPAPNCWGKPAVVHDFDGDGKADIAAATCTDYSVYEVSNSAVTPKWTDNNIQDASGLATATAFDFLGDGVAEAIYADETQIYVLDGKTGGTYLTAPRKSGTLIEYPVVADVDNDGSAEILFVSNYAPGDPDPTLVVLRDEQERWIPARRIWNQYSYHVTNVREDGTIPKVMKKSWQLLNTFRTNSQISVGGVDCNPEEPPK